MAVLYTTSFSVDDLATKWTVGNGTWAITAGVLRASAGTAPRTIRTNSSAYAATADMLVTVKYAAGTGFDGGPTVRHQSGADTCYYLDATAANITVFRRVAGVDSAALATLAAGVIGDSYGLQVTGTGATVTLKVFKNGAQVGSDILDSNAARITASGWGGVLDWAFGSDQDFDNFSVDDLIAANVLEQEGYRWRNDDGSETTATWKAAQDANVTLTAGSAARLRMLANTTTDLAAKRFRLKYRKVGDVSWRNLTPP